MTVASESSYSNSRGKPDGNRLRSLEQSINSHLVIVILDVDLISLE